MHGAQLAIAVEHLRRKHGAREAEAHGQCERQNRREPTAEHGHRNADDAGQEEVRDRRAPDLVAQQRLDAQLEADGEEQQQHAGVREVVEHRAGLHAERREHETRCEKADERR